MCCNLNIIVKQLVVNQLLFKKATNNSNQKNIIRRLSTESHDLTRRLNCFLVFVCHLVAKMD